MLAEHDAGWSSSVARRAHNPEVIGSNPVPATKKHQVKPGYGEIRDRASPRSGPGPTGLTEQSWPPDCRGGSGVGVAARADVEVTRHPSHRPTGRAGH